MKRRLGRSECASKMWLRVHLESDTWIYRWTDTLLLPLSGSTHAIGKSPGFLEDFLVIDLGNPRIAGIL